MSQTPFVLIAQAEVSAPAAQQVINRLQASFGVTVTAEQLIVGAAVLQTPTKEGAEGQVEAVLSAGANCRIVDAAGTVVLEVGCPTLQGRTMIGGHASPLAPPPPPAPPVAPPAPIRKAATLDGLDVDGLDADSLVALDGSEQEAPPPASFAPTSEDVGNDPYGSPGAGSYGSPGAGSYGSPGAGQYSPPADQFSPPTDDYGPGPDAPLELDMPVRAMAPPPPSEDAPALAELAPPAPAAAPAPLAPISAPSTASRSPARRSRRAFVEIPSHVLFNGRLRTHWPRLRILAGFILALLLGSVWPSCHASSVVANRIEPARRELSRAKTYGHLLAGQPSFRSAAEIEDYISSLKTRHVGYGIIMWFACGGVVGFLWFRFT